MTVTLDQITKAYGDNAIVKGIDLALRRGEIFTLLGPSGCGKTTTLRMVAGLERPDSGTLSIGGRVVAGPGVFVPPEDRRLGMVFQSYAVWPHRTVAENVAYPLALRKDPDAASKTKAILARVRLDGLAERYPHMLSGGQQQRVALARALVANPEVLLLDEPLSNLDAGLREELRGTIAELAREQGLTVLLVTHDQEEALSISDRVGVMLGGRLEQVSPPAELYSEPKNATLARFVGTLNTLPGLRRDGRLSPLDKADPGPDGPVTIGFRPEWARFASEGIAVAPVSSSYRGASTRHRLRAGEAELVIDAPGAPGAFIQIDRCWVWPA
jgi:ABC-type Fe3+/spermidine/putrescine transport system ATPase subunit